MTPQYATRSKPVRGTVVLSRQDEPPNGPWVVVAEFSSMDEVDRYLATVNAHGELLAALARCEVVMDTAARHGVGDILPPGYRDSWAAAHTEARRVLAALARGKED